MADEGAAGPSSGTATRRRFAATLGGCGLAAIGAVGLLGAPTTDPDPPDGAFVERSDLRHADRLDDGEGRLRDGVPVVRWQRELTRDGFQPTSPVNVAVALGPEHALADAMAVFEDANWQRRPEEYLRFARSPAGEWEPVHAAAAESTFGSAPRHHVRAWAFDDVVSIQAHEDTVPSPGHSVASYRSARQRVEALFADAGWRVAPAALDVGNDADPDHDGRLTVIEP